MADVETPVGIGTGRLLSGLVGRGILQSRSPWMHEAEADAQGLRLVYSLFDFADRGWSDAELPRLLDAAQRVGFAGLNVTFPFKQAVIPFLDELSAGARAIGAVNTVAFKDGKRIGYNTDVTGFAEGFRRGLPDVRKDRVLQLGCGGAGSATAHALLSVIGVTTLFLHDNDAARAEALAGELTDVFGEGRAAVVTDPNECAVTADGIVNATPVGMAKFPGMPISANAIQQSHWIAEIVYVPLETELLAEARRKGCRTVDGSGMAVHQAAEAFEIFTGAVADRARMERSFAAYVVARSVAAKAA